MKPNILVANDDGINGPGLKPLVAAMRGLGTVTVVVPDQERSADSHSLTLHKPIRIHRIEAGVYTLNGSPADCVRFAVLEILKRKLDLVVAGINRGYNLGEDVIYSGTVAAAREATLLNVPALAFSQDPRGLSYAASAACAKRLVRLVLRRQLPPGVCLNVNFPASKAFKPALPCRLGRRIYSQIVTKRADPRGGHYYWLAGKSVSGVNAKGTDVAAVYAGRVSVTPLHIDNTDFAMLETLKTWEL